MNNDLRIQGTSIYFQGYRVAELLSSASVPATVEATFLDFIKDLQDEGWPDEDEEFGGTDRYDEGYDDGYAAGMADGQDEGYNEAMAEIEGKEIANG